jgi:hypothetical protein
MRVELKPGGRFRSVACDGEVVVVKTTTGLVDLRCGGHPMVALDDDSPATLGAEPGFDAGLLIGKRYTDASGGLEVLCTKAGTSSLSIGDELLTVKGAKPLPSSD